MRKKFLSIVLILCLVVTYFPATALADTEIVVDGNIYTNNTEDLQASSDTATDGNSEIAVDGTGYTLDAAGLQAAIDDAADGDSEIVVDGNTYTNDTEEPQASSDTATDGDSEIAVNGTSYTLDTEALQAVINAAADGDSEIAVDGTGYTLNAAGLQAAIDAAADGDTVKLEGDIDLGPTGVTITDKTITLDLNDHTITYSGTNAMGTAAAVTLSGAANLTVQDSGTSGTITSASKCKILRNIGSGTLTFASGTIKGTGLDQTFGISNEGTGSVNITGGTVETTNMFALLIDGTAGDVTISGGTLRTSSWGTINHNTNNDNTAKLTISGDALIECSGTFRTINMKSNTASLEIKGGKIKGGDDILPKGTVEISGGYIGPKILASSSKIKVTGGFFDQGIANTDKDIPIVEGGYIPQQSNTNFINGDGEPLKVYHLSLIGADGNRIKDMPITGMSTNPTLDYEYGLNDVRTDKGGGFLHVWLPEDITWFSVTADGNTYSGPVAYTTELRLPSQNPAADTTSVAKTRASQASVDFTLTTAPTGTWKVYSDADSVDVMTGVTAALNGTTLTLTASAGSIQAGDYYVSVTEHNKNESTRLKLTVEEAPPILTAAAPVITNNLSTTLVEYNQNAAAAPLTVTAESTDDGTLSYEWYSNTINSTVGATALGANTPTYTPSTVTAGTTYYFCVVTNTKNTATGTKTAQTTSNIARVKVNAPVVNTAPPVITNDLSTTQVEYSQNAAAAPLTVTAESTDGGTLTYEWYSNTTNSTVGATALGVTTPTYTPSTATAGTTYYFCVVTNTNNAVTGTKTAQTTSNIASIKVNALVHAAVPVITNNLSTTLVEYSQNAPAAPLTVTAESTDDGTLSYEWYSNTTNSTVGATALGANTPTYTPSTVTAGTTYYFCVVTNTKNTATGTKTAQTTSNFANIKVNAPVVNAEYPVITNDLSTTQVEFSQNAPAAPLTVTAESTDGGTLTYAWYSNTTNSTVGATALGVTTPAYTPSTATVGTTYYFCVVTNTNNAVTGTQTAQTTSAIANIKVNAKGSGGSGGGGGGSSSSSTVSDTPVIAVSEVKSELFSNAEDIKVEADVKSAFGQSVIVKLTDNADSQKEIFSLAGANDKVYPFDISLYSKQSGEKVQPKDGYRVKITLPVPKELLDEREKIKVVYGKDGQLETLKSELIQKDGKWYITFEAVHFSPYALIVSEEKPAQPDTAPWANPFSDVQESDWYYAAVQYAYQNGLMKGTGSNTFSPEVVTSRGMIATILYNLDGSSETEQSTFQDVKSSAYYAHAVAWAQKKGIIAGYGNGMFGPDDSITREQLAAMLWKYVGCPEVTDSKGLASFKDAGEISAYAQNAMAWANQKGIINGKGGGLLDPKGQATRAEAAQIMKNFLQKVTLIK